MTECLCGHGEWCRHCTMTTHWKDEDGKPNYKYESFEEWLSGIDIDAYEHQAYDFCKYAYNAAREVKDDTRREVQSTSD